MVAVAGGPLGQDDPGEAVRVRVEQDEHRRPGARSGPVGGTRGGRCPPIPSTMTGITASAGGGKGVGQRRQPLEDEVEAHRAGRRRVRRRLVEAVAAGDRRRAGSDRAGAARVAPRAALGDDRRARGREHERPADRIGVGRDPVARLELAGDERPGQRVLDEALDRPLERPCPVGRIRALADDQRRARRRQLERRGPASARRRPRSASSRLDDLLEVAPRSARGRR